MQMSSEMTAPTETNEEPTTEIAEGDAELDPTTIVNFHLNPREELMHTAAALDTSENEVYR